MLGCLLAMPLYGQDLDSLSLESLLDHRVQTAAKYEQTVAEAPASVTIVTAEQIRRYGYASLADVVQAVRGFYLAHDHVRAYIGTRGFGRMVDFNNRVLVLLNGHTLNERLYGIVAFDEDFPVHLSAVERVEIVRGPGSALYGTGAMFAVINVVTKTPPATDGLAVRGEMGGHGTLRSSVVASRAFQNGMQLFAAGSWSDAAGRDLYFEEFDAPETNDGRAEGQDWRRAYSAFASAGLRGWSAQALLTRSDRGIPTGEFGSLFNDDQARYEFTRAAVEVRYERALGPDKALMARAFFDATGQALLHTYPVAMPAMNLEGLTGLHRIDAQARSAGAESIFRWDLRADNRLVVGAQYIENYRIHLATAFDFDGTQVTLFDGTFPYRMLSAYVQDEYQVRPNLALTLGLRQDVYARTATTTPRAALVFHPRRGTTFKLLYGEAFREPNSPEMHFEGFLERAVSNPALRPEKIRTAEAIWEQRLGERWSATASVFDYRVKDLITSVFLPGDSLSQFQNISRVEATGAEIELDGRISRSLDGFASYSFQTAAQRGPDGEGDLVNSPRHLVKAGLSVRGLPYVELGVQAFYEDRRRTKTATTPPFGLVNLHLTSKPVWQHVRFSALVRNLFDATYAFPASQQHVQDAFVQRGRHLIVRLSYTR